MAVPSFSAAGVDKHEGSYTRFLDRNGLKGARIGILRDPAGLFTEPNSEDYKKVDAVFANDQFLETLKFDLNDLSNSHVDGALLVV